MELLAEPNFNAWSRGKEHLIQSARAHAGTQRVTGKSHTPNKGEHQHYGGGERWDHKPNLDTEGDVGSWGPISTLASVLRLSCAPLCLHLRQGPMSSQLPVMQFYLHKYSHTFSSCDTARATHCSLQICMYMHHEHCMQTLSYLRNGKFNWSCSLVLQVLQWSRTKHTTYWQSQWPYFKNLLAGTGFAFIGGLGCIDRHEHKGQ